MLSVRRVAVATAAAVAVASFGFVIGRHGDRIDRQVATTQTVTREIAEPPSKGDGSSLPPALARARPRAAQLVATWSLSSPRPRLTLIYWRLPAGRSAWGTSVLEVWRGAGGGWTRLYERRRPGWTRFEIETGDVTQDAVSDVLVTEWNGGSGYCGARLLLSVQAGRVHELFRRYYCERQPAVVNDMLLVAEPIGDCPSKFRGAHCYGGLRTQVLAWSGRRRVIDHTLLRCFAGLRPERFCRRAA